MLKYCLWQCVPFLSCLNTGVQCPSCELFQLVCSAGGKLLLVKSND